MTIQDISRWILGALQDFDRPCHTLLGAYNNLQFRLNVEYLANCSSELLVNENKLSKATKPVWKKDVFEAHDGSGKHHNDVRRLEDFMDMNICGLDCSIKQSHGYSCVQVFNSVCYHCSWKEKWASTAVPSRNWKCLEGLPEEDFLSFFLWCLDCSVGFILFETWGAEGMSCWLWPKMTL